MEEKNRKLCEAVKSIKTRTDASWLSGTAAPGRAGSKVSRICFLGILVEKRLG